MIHQIKNAVRIAFPDPVGGLAGIFLVVIILVVVVIIEPLPGGMIL